MNGLVGLSSVSKIKGQSCHALKRNTERIKVCIKDRGVFEVWKKRCFKRLNSKGGYFIGDNPNADDEMYILFKKKNGN